MRNMIKNVLISKFERYALKNIIIWETIFFDWYCVSRCWMMEEHYNTKIIWNQHAIERLYHFFLSSLTSVTISSFDMPCIYSNVCWLLNWMHKGFDDRHERNSLISGSSVYSPSNFYHESLVLSIVCKGLSMKDSRSSCWCLSWASRSSWCCSLIPSPLNSLMDVVIFLNDVMTFPSYTVWKGWSMKDSRPSSWCWSWASRSTYLDVAHKYLALLFLLSVYLYFLMM